MRQLDLGLQALKIGGVSEDEVSVVELDRPASARSADKSVSDGDCAARRITKVIDDDATALITAAGIGQHTLAYREIRTV